MNRPALNLQDETTRAAIRAKVGAMNAVIVDDFPDRREAVRMLQEILLAPVDDVERIAAQFLLTAWIPIADAQARRHWTDEAPCGCEPPCPPDGTNRAHVALVRAARRGALAAVDRSILATEGA